MPDLYIITGSNGAGKSSIGNAYLPPDIQRYDAFDGDLLSEQKKKELFPNITRSPKEAKRIADQFVLDTFDRLVENALEKKETFVYEGHFTNEATWSIPERFKRAGYTTHLLFFGLTNPDLSQLRVIERANAGGHYVTRIDIETNFYGNLHQLDKHFYLIEDLMIVDTSEIDHVHLASFLNQKHVAGLNYQRLPEWFSDNLPELSRLVPNGSRKL